MKIGNRVIDNAFENTNIYYSVRKDLFTALSMEDWDEFGDDVTNIVCQYVGRALINIIIEKDETWF